MKRILIVHERSQYDLALRLAHALIVSGYDAVCTQDLFEGNTGTEIREDINAIYSSTSVFIILADSKIFKSEFHVETIHDAKRLKKSITILVGSETTYPVWFFPDIVLNGRPDERLWNQVIERIKPLIHNQPFVLHPETARFYRLH